MHRRLVGTAADRAQLRDLVDGAGAVLDELARRRLVMVPDDAVWRTGTRDRRLQTTLGYNHPVGTCRMGSDDRSVCDLRLRVRGVDRLMVADASVMPDIPRSQTNLPAMMIGYRAGEFLDLRA